MNKPQYSTLLAAVVAVLDPRKACGKRLAWALIVAMMYSSIATQQTSWAMVAATDVVTKVVGDGTPASCTETALASTLAGGGTVTFACGGAYTIPITRNFVIMDDTTIDGGGQITLDGGGVSRIFYVNKWDQHNGILFALQNIALTNGQSGGDLDPHFGGCIYSRRSVLQLTQVSLTGCKAVSGGGGVYVYGGNALISASTFTDGEAKEGGAVYATPGHATQQDVAGYTTVISSTFTGNAARGDGGAIYSDGSPVDVQHSTFTRNAALGTTGEPFAGLGGGIYTNLAGAVAHISDSRFVQNMSHENGGGVFADYYTTTSVTNSQFIENTSTSYGGGLGIVRAYMSIDSSEFRRNHGINGGGIFNGARVLTVTNTILAENIGEGGGGGIYNGGKKLTLRDSTVMSNTAGTTIITGMQGGGLVSYSNTISVDISGSTFAGNQAIGPGASGGGIWFGGATLAITNTTISGNSATRYGGGIEHNAGATSISSSTIANNTAAGFGPNIGINKGSPILTNTLVVGNTSLKNCNKNVTDGGHNLQFPDTSCSASIRVADPELDVLRDNGGGTQTHALAATSPAVNQGADCPGVDQRDYVRDGLCDIGAFELDAIGPPVTPLLYLSSVVRSSSKHLE